MKHVTIGAPPADTAAAAPATRCAPAPVVTFDKWVAFLGLVRELRRVQTLHERTADVATFAAARVVADRVDAWVGELAADVAAIAAAGAEAVATHTALAKGGAL